MINLDSLWVFLFRAVCRKHELTQFELEMSSQDLVSKKQQREELATGVNHTSSTLLASHSATQRVKWSSPDSFQSSDSTVTADVFRPTRTEA